MFQMQAWQWTSSAIIWPQVCKVLRQSSWLVFVLMPGYCCTPGRIIVRHAREYVQLELFFAWLHFIHLELGTTSQCVDVIDSSTQLLFMEFNVYIAFFVWSCRRGQVNQYFCKLK